MNFTNCNFTKQINKDKDWSRSCWFTCLFRNCWDQNFCTNSSQRICTTSATWIESLISFVPKIHVVSIKASNKFNERILFQKKCHWNAYIDSVVWSWLATICCILNFQSHRKLQLLAEKQSITASVHNSFTHAFTITPNAFRFDFKSLPQF